ncbi:hypothetical protein DBR32_14770 [Taibaiella sp. KBW10]|nr:hypothetical protein DBR32_14770 [Taibaiella sp. KBW10]
MKWYHYIAAFFAGVFLTNALPHFMNGISGNPFPTPFADPPGKGLSSPLINILWALFNLIAGYLLLRYSKATTKNRLSVFFFFIGLAVISLLSSITFVDKVQ